MSEIKFYSTNLKAKEVNIKDAILNGLAEDKGLYFPHTIPKLSEDEIKSLKDLDYPAIAQLILGKFLEPYVDKEPLKQICQDAYNYAVPLENLHDH